MASGRYPSKPAWAFRANHYGNTFTPLRRANRLATNPTPWLNWFFANDTITAKTTYDSGYATLKRWNGTMWIAAPLKVYFFR